MSIMKTESDETKKLEDSQMEIITSKEEMFSQINLKIEKDNVVKRDFYSHQKHFYKKIGNTLGLLFDKTGYPLIVIGPHCIHIIK
jgi:hypothetical protein